MKFKVSLRNKEASVEADVEKLISKGMDIKAARPERKSRYQIRQEEKRKNEELKHKHEVQMLLIGIGVFFVLLGICLVLAMFE